MIPAFYKESEIIVNALAEAKEKIQAIYSPDFEAVKTKVVREINQRINSLRVNQMELDPITFDDSGYELFESKGKATEGPIKKLFGKEVIPISRSEQFAIQIPHDPNAADIDFLGSKFQQKEDKTATE